MRVKTGRPPTPVDDSLRRRCWAYVWKAALVLAVCWAGLWTATHGVAGVAWGDVAEVLRSVSLWHLLLLAAIWLGGLAIYAIVLTAALPGLGFRRSLLLNLTGSAVANVLPLGGAVATALNWRMVRIWGHSDRAFVTFCVVTNVLDVLTKLFLPLIGVAALALLSVDVPPALWAVAGMCSAALVLVLAAQLLIVGRTSARRPAVPCPGGGLRQQLRESGDRIRRQLVVSWTRLLPGSIGYVAAQIALLYFCLRAVGLDVPVSVVLMAAGIERLGSLVPLTPGGTGIAEIGTIAWLLVAGLDPVPAVAGLLLYRVFLIALEIPVGGILLGGWVWRRRTSTEPSGERVAR